jgi:YfiH family protein
MARHAVCLALGIGESWATVIQVHGGRVISVSETGSAGEADALWTVEKKLPLAVFTADCYGVVLHAPGAVGVAHAGWRGVKAGVVGELRSAMSEADHAPTHADMGPGIGSCCFEVGEEVSALFPGYAAETTWQTSAVDLHELLRNQLTGLDLWTSGDCTMHQDGWFSHRENRTSKRLATIGWLP